MSAPMWRRSGLTAKRILNNYICSCRFTSEKTVSTSQRAYQEKNQTHFGYEYIPEDEKEERVYKVFENVATRYDLMNDAMSLGIHRLWKDYFINKMSPTSGTKLIDVAGGTGDISFRFLNFVQNEEKSAMEGTNFKVEAPPELRNINELDSTPDIETNSSQLTCATVCDINQAMLDVGRDRAEKLGVLSDISFIQGNAEDLPLESNKFDVYTIAYGIRNCTHIDKVLSEAYRVLKPGGRFMCLEFSHVTNPVLRQVYDSYSFQVIPVMGQVLAKDWKSYQYLVESIRQFPKQDEFAGMIRQVGFKMVSYENLTFGITAIHSGFKL